MESNIKNLVGQLYFVAKQKNINYNGISFQTHFICETNVNRNYSTNEIYYPLLVGDKDILKTILESNNLTFNFSTSIIKFEICLKNSDKNFNLSLITETTKQNFNYIVNKIGFHETIIKSYIAGLIEIFKNIDELEYYRLFETNHYNWLHNPENPKNILKQN